MSRVDDSTARPVTPDQDRSDELVIGPYVFTRATSAEDDKQIHELNFQTFVREVPQHIDPGNGQLVDKFHAKNQYFLARRDGEIVGMIAVHDEAPFSVTKRLPDPNILPGLGSKPIEVRLLAIQPDQRNRMVFAGLLWLVYQYINDGEYSHLLISAFADRLTLYHRLGFQELGPAVPDGEASFVPMVCRPDQFPAKLNEDIDRFKRLMARRNGETSDVTTVRKQLERVGPTPLSTVSLLPGPVSISDDVAQAWAETPISHRSKRFIDLYEYVKTQLGELVGGNGIQTAILCGSGTLANDAVAATIAADTTMKRGLVLVNGEFGRRLVDQATRFALDFESVETAWGDHWDFDHIEATLKQHDDGSKIDWIWAVHLESSTGMLNNLPRLVQLGKRYGVRVCVDCVSSLGAVPIDLSDIHLASGIGGKSIAAYAGLAFVFTRPETLSGVQLEQVPNYLDVISTINTQGPRFTTPSPLFASLAEALKQYDGSMARAERYAAYETLGQYIRSELRRLGIEPLVAEPLASPIITSFIDPTCTDINHSSPTTSPEAKHQTGLAHGQKPKSSPLVDQCIDWGYELSGCSIYLVQRGWVQIATMGLLVPEHYHDFFIRLERFLEDH